MARRLPDASKAFFSLFQGIERSVCVWVKAMPIEDCKEIKSRSYELEASKGKEW